METQKFYLQFSFQNRFLKCILTSAELLPITLASFILAYAVYIDGVCFLMQSINIHVGLNI